MSERLTTADFKQKVFNFEAHDHWQFEGDLPAIVDFYSDWCPPCALVAPVLDAIGEEYQSKVRIYQVNTDEEQTLAAVFGIQSLPSLLFIPRQGEPRMAVGALPKPQILKAMREVMAVE